MIGISEWGCAKYAKAMNSGVDERSRAAANALASIRLEGGEINPETQQLVERYVAGEITVDQLLAHGTIGAGRE